MSSTSRVSAAGSPSDSTPHQRAFGHLVVGVRRRGAATVLARLRQEGCLKARLPRPEPGAWTEAVTLNSSGGIAGGDRLETEISVAEDAALTVASQAAERVYRALPRTAPSRVRTHLVVEPGGRLEWLPQETILFDGSALERILTVDLAENAGFLGVESLVFGRAAMGEQVRQAFCRDRLIVRRAGRLLLHDTIRIDGAVAGHLARPAIAAGARAVATLIHVTPGIGEAELEALRVALADAEAGASLWDGLLLARIVAPDQATLRLIVTAGLQSLRACRKLPRVWMC